MSSALLQLICLGKELILHTHRPDVRGVFFLIGEDSSAHFLRLVEILTCSHITQTLLGHENSDRHNT